MTADDLETVQEFLDERSDGETVLEAVLAVDADHGTWTFDDVNLDSGTFGELVSRGIVTKVDGAYQVAAPAVVESVLTGEELEKPTNDNDLTADFDRFWNDVDLRALA